MRLLVVEDHADTAHAFSYLLSRFGHTVDVAGDIHAALELCSLNAYDITLTDIGLPDGTGWDLMRELLARGPMRGIAISGYGYDAEKSLEAGFDEHLTKPVLIEPLLAAVKRVGALPMRSSSQDNEGLSGREGHAST
jgi:DNA-binding response OmpR family regulator